MGLLEQAASIVVDSCARVRPGEKVAISGRADNLPFCELIALQVFKAGGIPVLAGASDDYQYRVFTEIPPEVLEQPPAHLVELFAASDVVITVNIEWENPARFVDVPEASIAARRRSLQPVRQAIFDGKTRWVGLDFPTPGQASTYGVDFQTYSNTFWQAMMIDYEELKRDCDRIIAGLQRGTALRLQSPAGSDLMVGYGGRKLCRDDGIIDDEDMARGDGGSNLPAGEVCFAPTLADTNGTLVLDLATWYGHRIEGLVLEFKAGRATPVRADRGFEAFTSVLDNSTGDKDLIGELGIGLNKAVTEAVGCTLVDEKLRGSVHVALGLNTMLGGENVSDLHWDMLVLDPTVTVGSEVLIDRGKVIDS